MEITIKLVGTDTWRAKLDPGKGKRKVEIYESSFSAILRALETKLITLGLESLG